MEDPLFDPWGDVGDSASDDAPGALDVPTPRDPVAETVPTPLRGIPSPAEGPLPPRWRPVEGSPTPRPRSAPRALSRPSDVTPRPEVPLDPAPLRVSPLTEVVLPALRALTQRLELARHDVRIDDRSDRMPSSVRFQFHAWTGPFDDSPTRPAPVLEFVEENGGEQVTIRTPCFASFLAPHELGCL